MAYFQERQSIKYPVYADRNGVLTKSEVIGTGTEAALAVTVNAPVGKITLAAVLNATTGIDITLTNSYITASSVILLSVLATTATAAATRKDITGYVVSQTAGSCVLHLYNADAANSSAAPVIHFRIIN